METQRNFKVLAIMAIISALVLVEIIAFVLMKTGAISYIKNLAKGQYQKPVAWVIPQSLNSTLARQQLLVQSAKGGKVSLEDLAKVATASVSVKAEAVKIGSDYLLSTGADGKVEVEVDPGNYRVEMVSVPGVDFTGVPGTADIKGGTNTLSIGLVKGSGKVRTEGGGLKMEAGSENKLKVNLFSDKNENGVKDSGEPDLPWAGVTVKLSRSS